MSKQELKAVLKLIGSAEARLDTLAKGNAMIFPKPVHNGEYSFNLVEGLHFQGEDYDTYEKLNALRGEIAQMLDLIE